MCCRKSYKQYWHYVLQETIQAILTLCAAGNNTGNIDIVCCRKQYRQYWHYVLQETIQTILTLCAAGNNTGNIEIMCCRKQYRHYWHYVLQEIIQAILTLCAAGNNRGNIDIMCCREQYRQYWHYVLQETIQALLTLYAAGNNTGNIDIMCCRKQYRHYWHYMLQETIQAILTLCAAGNNTGIIDIMCCRKQYRQCAYNVALRRVRETFYWSGKSISFTYSACVFVALACNAHAPYCHLLPACFYNIFPCCLTNGTIIEHKMCIFYVFCKVCPKHFSLLRRIERDMIEMCIGLHVKYRLFLSDFHATWNFGHFSKNIRYQISFKKIPSGGRWFVQADGQTDVKKLIVAFANAPKKILNKTDVWD